MTEADRIAALETKAEKLSEKVGNLQNIAWILGGLAIALGAGGAGLWATLNALKADAEQVKRDLQASSEQVKKLNENLAQQVALALAPQLDAAKVAVATQQDASVAAVKREVLIADNCVTLTSLQICWGTSSLTPEPSAPHTAPFAFTFGRPFASTPTVTASPSVNGSGHMVGVYAWSSTGTAYTGRVNNVYLNERLVEPVAMSYVAIGRPAR